MAARPSSICPLQSSSMPLHVSGAGTQVLAVAASGLERLAASPESSVDEASALGASTMPASSIESSIPLASSPVRPQAESHAAQQNHSGYRGHNEAPNKVALGDGARCREGIELEWHTVGTEGFIEVSGE